MKPVEQELSVIRKTYDCILWFAPILSKLPREHKFTIGEHIMTGLYGLLDGLVRAQGESRPAPATAATLSEYTTTAGGLVGASRRPACVFL